jgi:NADH-quinone oxidoreductase subunit M
MLPMVQKVLFNELDKPENMKMEDLSGREMVVLSPLVFLMLFIGVFPQPILERMEPSVEHVLELAGAPSASLAQEAVPELEFSEAAVSQPSISLDESGSDPSESTDKQ